MYRGANFKYPKGPEKWEFKWSKAGKNLREGRKGIWVLRWADKCVKNIYK
jgi:hypothetical protein